MKDLLIFGTTSLARLAQYYAIHDQGMSVLGFVVDESYKTSDSFLSVPVFTWKQIVKEYSAAEVDFFVAIGYKNMRLRAAKYKEINDAGYNCVNIISKSCFIADNVMLGNNNFIMPGSVLEPSVQLGSNNIIWSNVTICHDTQIGHHNFIASNVTVGGEVKVGDQNFIGFSATVLQQLVISNETLIGAQSLITKNTATLSEYRGSPAKKVAAIDENIGIKV